MTFNQNSAGQWYIQKFRPSGSTVRTNAYQDDVHIYIYRGSELYFMLAEALNQLGRTAEASALINQGVNGTFPNGGVTWPGFTDAWTSVTAIGNRKYPDKGIRGVFSLANRPFSNEDKKLNDLAILDEMMLEFPCEGKYILLCYALLSVMEIILLLQIEYVPSTLIRMQFVIRF